MVIGWTGEWTKKSTGRLNSRNLTPDYTRLPELYKDIKGQYLKGILKRKQDDFLNALFGFVIISDMKSEQRWEISFEGFSQKVADLTETHRQGTVQFPDKYINPGKEATTEEIEEHKSHLFVKKIHDIEYSSEVPLAVKSYLSAMITVREEFKNYSVPVKRKNKRLYKEGVK